LYGYNKGEGCAGPQVAFNLYLSETLKDLPDRQLWGDGTRGKLLVVRWRGGEERRAILGSLTSE